MIRIFFSAALMGVLAACAVPTSSVISGSARPSLRLTGAPDGSILVLDGRSMGDAKRFDGVNGALAIEEGPHIVEVRQGLARIVQKRIFAASGEAVSVDVLVPETTE